MNQINPTFMLPRFSFLLRNFQWPASNKIAVLMAVFLFAFLSLNTARAAEPGDPLEVINRPVHGFNRVIDKIIIKPLATTYAVITPRFIKKGLRNVLSNVDDVVVTVNDVLQGDFRQAGSDLGRVAINSTLGLGGLIDVADNVFELEKHDQDFGQTLAHWGVERGPYVVLPLLGPSTLREGTGKIFDAIVNPAITSVESAIRDPYLVTSALDMRARYLAFDDLVIGDDYLFLREMYLQNLDFRESDESQWVAFEEF